jgi:hypothetical protein
LCSAFFFAREIQIRADIQEIDNYGNNIPELAATRSRGFTPAAMKHGIAGWPCSPARC